MSKSRRHRLSARQQRTGHFARINKNFLNQWSVPNSDGYTALEQDLLLLLLNDAQERGRSRLTYQSLWAMRKQLGLGVDGGEQYRRLRRALRNLTELRFEFEHWYNPRRKGEWKFDPDDVDDVEHFADKFYDGQISNREAKKEIRRRNRSRYQQRAMGCIRGVRRRLDGRITVKLDPVFFKVNRAKTYYCPAYLDDARALRTLAAKRLLLIVRSRQVEKSIVYDIGKWAHVLGLYDTNLARWRTKFLRAIEAVEAVRDGAIDVYERPNGKICVTPERAKTSERGDHQLGGR